MTKKESSVGYLVKLTLILFLISAVVALLLGGVNAITKDKIAAINEQKADAIALVITSDAAPEEASDFDPSSGITHVYKMGDDGYAVEVVVSGSQGSIDVMVGVAPDSTITGVSIVSHSETAGLGAVYAGDTDAGVAFRDSFIGKSGSFTAKDVVYKSGATISANAICNAGVIASDYVAGLG